MATEQAAPETAPKSKFRRKLAIGLALGGVLVALLVWVPQVIPPVIAVLAVLSVGEVLTTRQPPDRLPWGYKAHVFLRAIMTGIVYKGAKTGIYLFDGSLAEQALFFASLFGVIATDSCAQLGGMFYKKLDEKFGMPQWWLDNPLPTISPKKTNIGFMSGFMGGMFTVLAVLVMSGVDHYWLSVVIPLAGIVGDLFASMVKRSIGAKDYTFLWFKRPILDEQGGITDRGDGHWMSFAVLGILLPWLL